MIKATPEIEAKIKASGIPIIEITLEQLQKVQIVKEKPNKFGNLNKKQYIKNHEKNI